MSVIYKNEEFKPLMKDNLLTLDLSGKGIKNITEIENLLSSLNDAIKAWKIKNLE